MQAAFRAKSGSVCSVYVVGVTESAGNKTDSSDLARKKMVLAVETVREGIQHAYYGHETPYRMIYSIPSQARGNFVKLKGF